MKLIEMGEIIAIEYMGFPTIAVDEPLYKYWHSYFGHYDADIFHEGFKWAVRHNPTGFPPTPGMVSVKLEGKAPTKQRALPKPEHTNTIDFKGPRSDVDIVCDCWGDSEYRKMLLELLGRIAPEVDVDPANPSSIVKLCYVKGWAPKYKQWLQEQVEMIKNLEAHPA